MTEDEIEYGAHYKRCLYFSMKWITAAMTSSCRKFVYKDVTSAVTKRVLDGGGEVGGGGGWKFFNKFEKCFVSLMFDGRLLARG